MLVWEFLIGVQDIVCVGVGVPHWPSGYSVCWCGSSLLAFRI